MRLKTELPLLLKTLGLTTAACMSYGIIHDQITARICVEYFTLGHPFIVHSQSPTVLGFVWGILATVGMSILFGLLLYYAAYRGHWPKYSLKKLYLPIIVLMLLCGLSAAGLGFIGYKLTQNNIVILSSEWSDILSDDIRANFFGVWFAHIGSYFTGITGGIIIMIRVLISRKKMRNTI